MNTEIKPNYINYTPERENEDGSVSSILFVEVEGKEYVIKATPPESFEEMKQKVEDAVNEE